MVGQRRSETATHGVLQAKLPGGEDMGPHLCPMQLLSLDTHARLPRRLIGDIGPKALGGYVRSRNRLWRIRDPCAREAERRWYVVYPLQNGYHCWMNHREGYLELGLFRRSPAGNPQRSRDSTRALRLAIAGLCGSPTRSSYIVRTCHNLCFQVHEFVSKHSISRIAVKLSQVLLYK
ncbi:hypothetical protein B0H12DRAFT_97675 [Mycena haematopus]|nr:hypothetical protein B0H12DRAFT_97675 [Mycena haematopus]